MQSLSLLRKCLAVGIILFFITTAVVPTTASEKSASRGHWLYVGGNGPGNYTKIQDAIDHASAGDTVFVYHDASPYNENIVLDTTLTLLGENRTTTQISGGGSPTVAITAPHTVISDFTITTPTNSTKDQVDGIHGVNCSDITIKNSTISGFYYGLSLEKSSGAILEGNTISFCHSCILIVQSSKIIIHNNTINGTEAIQIVGGYGTIIDHNNISAVYGITMFLSLSFDCSSNHFTRCLGAVDCQTTPYGKIRYNIFQDCENGILLATTVGMWIVSNTFLNTTHEPEFIDSFFCHWRNNYWNHPRLFPKIILGTMALPLGFYYALAIPWINIDWHPAQTPYDTP